jgi:hypothetical protein
VWLAVLGFFVALCRASGLADEQAKQRATQRRVPRPAIERSGAQILDLGVWRSARRDRVVSTRGNQLLRAR